MFKKATQCRLLKPLVDFKNVIVNYSLKSSVDISMVLSLFGIDVIKVSRGLRSITKKFKLLECSHIRHLFIMRTLVYFLLVVNWD